MVAVANSENGNQEELFHDNKRISAGLSNC